LMKRDPETKVDFAGIAKGYAVDRAIEILKRKKLSDVLVEIGGEARALGKNKDGKPWRIGVLHPTKREYLAVLELSNKAVSTSGDYMKFFFVEGKRYSHLIDPRTGKPISNNVCSVTVIADNCTEADALATAISIMGAQEGLKLVESLPRTETIITRRIGEEGPIEVQVSTGLKALKMAP
jgi:thiamine biosynthesis lipoprotein